MREIPISRGYAALVDDEDYEDLSKFKWTALVVKNRNNVPSIVYAWRWTPAKDGPKRPILMHRCILRAVDSKVKIDHEDHDGLNNQKRNLRICSATQNHGNQRIRYNNSSGYKGVSWYRAYKKWQARIQVSGRSIKLGYFANIKDAAQAYSLAAYVHFGEFSYTGGSRTEL